MKATQPALNYLQDKEKDAIFKVIAKLFILFTKTYQEVKH